LSRDRQALKELRGAAGTTRGIVAITGLSIGAGSTLDIPLTIRGAMPGDSVRLEPPADLAAGLMKSHESVTAIGAVTLRLSNVTGGSISLATADWRFAVTRPK
jgi:glycerate-2-kinase